MNRTEAFLADIEAAQRKHGLSLGHEDDQGAFKVVPFNERYVDWLWDAFADGESFDDWRRRRAARQQKGANAR
jgi:hypothetical protein